MANAGGSELIRLKMYRSLAEDHIGDIEAEHMQDLAKLCESSNPEIRTESVKISNIISDKKPILLIPVFDKLLNIVEDSGESDEIRTLSLHVLKKLRNDPTIQEVASRLESQTTSNQPKESKNPRILAENAQSSELTAKRLQGRERYFYDVMPFLKINEQPHYLFALSQSRLLPYSSFFVDKRGTQQPILEKRSTGSVVVTDHGVRILSDSGRWAFSYNKITGVDTGNQTTPTLKVVSGGEIYQIKVAKSIHSQSQVRKASKLIMKAVGFAQR